MATEQLDANPIRRTASGWVDTERHCVTCAVPAPATEAQHGWPERVAELRAEATAYARLSKERAAKADALDAEIMAAPTPAFLCAGCRAHLHDHELAVGWAGGRHDRSDADFIKRTRKWIKDEAHQPGATGACLICQPGSTHRAKVTTA